MDENAINTIISLLPKKVIYDAACRHVIKLSQAGGQEEAKNLYDKLYSLDASSASLAEAARYLVGRHIARHEIDKALYIYERFPGDAENCDTLSEKLKTCHFLIFALIPDHLTKAYGLWREYAQYNLTPGLKWQWADTGLALLECCYKNDLSEMAAEIYRDIKRYGNCETSKAFMDKAEQLMKKISENTGHESNYF